MAVKSTEHIVDLAVEEEPSKGIVGDIINSLLHSGFGPGVITFLNVVFACLFVVLVALAIITNGNWHVVGLLGVALCLFGSVQWLIIELGRAKSEEAMLQQEYKERCKMNSSSQCGLFAEGTGVHLVDSRRRHSGLDGLGRDTFLYEEKNTTQSDTKKD